MHCFGKEVSTRGVEADTERSENTKDRLFRRTRKKCAFTNHLATHGFWNDCSMEVEKKRKGAKEWSERRKRTQQHRLHRTFEAQTRKIRDIQDALARRQNQMANGALHKYCAYKIQTRVRMFFAHNILNSLKAARLLKNWVMFRFYMKQRYRAGSKICLCIKNFLYMKRKTEWLRLYEAATILKRAFCVVMYTRRYRKKLTTRKAVDEAVGHMILFGSTRAFRAIRYDMESENVARVMRRLFSGYGRRKRIKMLRGPGGKVAYYYLQYTLVKELGLHSNDLIATITRWIDPSNVAKRKAISNGDCGSHESKKDANILMKRNAKKF